MENRNKNTAEIIDLDDEALEKVTGGVNVYPKDDEKKEEEEEEESASGNTAHTPSMSALSNIRKIPGNISISQQKRISSGTSLSDLDPLVGTDARMRTQVRALEKAGGNAQTDNAMMKTADGAITSTIDILKTMKEKAIRAASGDMYATDRDALQKEISAFIAQIDDNALTTFNGKILLDGSNALENGTARPNIFLGLEGSDLTADTALTDITDKDGNSVGIEVSDNLTVAVMYRGETYSGTVQVGNMSFKSMHDMELTSDSGSVKMGDILSFTSEDCFDGKNLLIASNKDTRGILCKAANTGVADQISAICIGVSDSNGTQKADVNAIFDSFSEICAAQDAVANRNGVTIPYGKGQTMKFGFGDMRASSLGLVGENGTIDVSNAVNATAAVEAIDNALQKVTDQQSAIAEAMVRLDYTTEHITSLSESIAATQATIEEADMAKEMVNYSKESILQQAEQAMSAQANSNAANILGLLR